MTVPRVGRRTSFGVETPGFLKRLRFEMRRQQRPGETMVCKGRVVSKGVDNDGTVVELEVWAENEREGVTTPGTATVVLPRRS